MTNEEMTRIIANHYGYDNQSHQCVEEMAELMIAINKFRRKEIPNRNNYELMQDIYEEIADVEVLLEQLKYFFNCYDEVNAMKEYKLKRELERIKTARGEKNDAEKSD